MHRLEVSSNATAPQSIRRGLYRRHDTLPIIDGGEKNMAARQCPYCRVVSNFRRGPSTNTSHAAKTPTHQAEQILALEECANCGALMYVRIHESNDALLYDQYPKLVDQAPEELPDPINKAFDEPLKCFGAEAPNGSLLMSRRALQEVMNDKKAKSGDLPTQLQDLVDKQIITPQLNSWADTARVGGRIAAHGTGGIAWGDPDKIWGDMADADTVIRYLQSLFDYMYVLDVRHRQRLGIPDDSPGEQLDTDSETAS